MRKSCVDPAGLDVRLVRLVEALQAEEAVAEHVPTATAVPRVALQRGLRQLDPRLKLSQLEADELRGFSDHAPIARLHGQRVLVGFQGLLLPTGRGVMARLVPRTLAMVVGSLAEPVLERVARPTRLRSRRE